MTRKFKKYNRCNFCGFAPTTLQKKQKNPPKKTNKKNNNREMPPHERPARAEWARAQTETQTKKKRQLARPHDSSPVGKPGLVAHMAFLSRREGGGFGTPGESTMESLIAPFSTRTSRLVPLARRLLCAASRELLQKAAAAQRESEPSFTRSHEPNDSGLYARGRFQISDNKM